MSAVEISRIKVRVEALETIMETMIATMERIEGMYDTVKTRHEEMMNEKADGMRAGMLAEIRANMDVVRCEMLQELKRAVRSCQS